MGRRSTTKGKRYEREVVRVFEAAGHRARRMAPLQARLGGDVPDVEVVATAPVDDVVLAVECKVSGRTPSPHAAMAQAIESAPAGALPVVVSRKDRGESLATLRLDDLLHLLRLVGEGGVEPAHELAHVVDLAAACRRVSLRVKAAAAAAYADADAYRDPSPRVTGPADEP